MKVSQKRRSGFTLIEVILAIVVVAVIMGIAIPKVMSNSDKASIKQSISSDVRSIIEAAADWKRTDRATAGGTYASINELELSSRLPSNMKADANDISSSGFNGGCKYRIVTDNADGRNFKLAMNCTTAATTLSWSDKLKEYAEQAFVDSALSLSSDARKTILLTVDTIDCTGVGASIDGKACVELITQ